MVRFYTYTKQIALTFNPASQKTTQIGFMNYKCNRCYENLSFIIYIWKFKLFGSPLLHVVTLQFQVLPFVDILISNSIELNFRLYSTWTFRISAVSDAASNGRLDR